MNYQDFKSKLKECGLTIKKFAEICGLSADSISVSWREKGKTPQWVDTWLDNYLKAKTLDNVKDVICSDNPTDK